MVPFVRTLATYPNIPRDWITGMQAINLDDRLPMGDANRMLALAVTATGDPYLAIKAGRSAARGDAGALDYVMSSAATVKDAFDAAGRYMRLINDSLQLQFVLDGHHACAKLVSAVVVDADVQVFGVAAFFNNCVLPVLGETPELEVLLTYPAPNDLREYHVTFPGAKLVFDAPWAGYRFNASRLSQSVATADPNLNQILRVHMDRSLADLPNESSLVDHTRQLIRRELPRGRATAPLIARELAMSRRTLCRRLEVEQTTFTQLLDDVRREIALEHVGQGHLALSEIAFLLGFAQTAGFHRAFKRWIGQTPVEYRATHR